MTNSMLSQRFKNNFRHSPLYDYFNEARYQYEYLLYVFGRLGGTPHILKRRLIGSRAKEYKTTVFVETGTLFGDMTHAQRKRFHRLYSIELDEYLHRRALKRFRNSGHIKLIQGDSGEAIKDVLEEITKPSLFWLDAHYSEGITAQGDENTPIFKEIKCILNHDVKNHIILIDDARDFNGVNGYPTLEQLNRFVKQTDSACEMSVEMDIINIVRKTP
jgi:hypothetical protein